MTYELHDDFIKRDDGAFIPKDEGNRDYQEYLEWVALGNTPDDPPTPPVVIPNEVTMRQARLALLAEDLLDTVNTNIASASQASQIEWEFSSTVKRDSALTVSMAAILSLTEQDLNNLFLAASAL